MTGLARGRRVIPAGHSLVCDDAWLDVYAVVAEGTVEVRTPHDGRLRLVPGDVLCLARIGPATLVAVGPDPAVLTTIHRTTPIPVEGVLRWT